MGLAHLLVNGDVASLVLFGGLGVWAFAEHPADQRPRAGLDAARGRDRSRRHPAPAITLVVFAVIVAMHGWLGYWPFPR